MQAIKASTATTTTTAVKVVLPSEVLPATAELAVGELVLPMLVGTNVVGSGVLSESGCDVTELIILMNNQSGGRLTSTTPNTHAIGIRTVFLCGSNLATVQKSVF
eukprot:m.162342 g.162342  ORF g.162342 m.162342 type:complete len:105 (-) comp14600_c0_seq8:1805-2119(-)